VALAGSPAYANQAFRWGERAYGVQFHLEVDAGLAHEWAAVPSYAGYLDRVLGPGSLLRLIDELETNATEMGTRGRAMFERWLDRADG